MFLTVFNSLPGKCAFIVESMTNEWKNIKKLHPSWVHNWQTQKIANSFFFQPRTFPNFFETEKQSQQAYFLDLCKTFIFYGKGLLEKKLKPEAADTGYQIIGICRNSRLDYFPVFVVGYLYRITIQGNLFFFCGNKSSFP